MKGSVLAAALLTLSCGRATVAADDPGAPPPIDASRLAAATAAPVKFRWSQKALGTGNDSSVAVDPAGRPHVVFSKFTRESYVLTHSWLDGKRWRSEPVDSGIGYDNALAIDADGGIHVAYAAEAIGTGWSLRYARKGSTGWTTETVEAGGLSNSIAVDPGGAPHILHIEGSGAGAVRHVRRTAGGRWEGETIAEGGDWGAGSSLLFRGEKAYATFSGLQTPRQLFLATGETGTWDVATIADGRAGSAAFDGAGVLHVVYAAEPSNALRHAWLIGDDWQEETLVSATDVLGESVPEGYSVVGEYPALAADVAGRLHLVFGLYASKGVAWGESLVYGAPYEAPAGTGWVPIAVSQGRIGFDSAVAVSPNGLVHIATRKTLGGEKSAIVAFDLKGATLSLSATKAKGTIRVVPTGTVCTGKCSEVFYPGTEVSLTAEPGSGFTFLGWGGACKGTDPTCAVSMNTGRKVTARFK